MTMRLQYGTYTHESGEAAVTIRREALRNESDAAYAMEVTWDIDLWIHAETQAELLARKIQLEQVYSTEGKDVRLLFADGTVAHEMRNSYAAGGIKLLTPLSYPEGRGAEWSTYRTIQYSLGGEFPLNNQEANLLTWTETVSHQGTGGPRLVLIEILNGPPQDQITNQRTICRVTQTGSATGYTRYPAVPAPLFPNWEKLDQRQIDRTSPRARNVGASRTFTDWRVNWSYTFEMPTLSPAFPNLKPRSA